MIASERKLYILNRLNETGVISLKEVVQALDISETTVRRDFNDLEREGKLNRVQGGAMRDADVSEVLEHVEAGASQRKNLFWPEKERIARKAAELVQDGESVFLDDGTSLVPLAHILLKRRVHIVTNSTAVLGQAKASMEASLFVLGGQYNPYDSLMYGLHTKRILNEFHFEHAFIGCFSASLKQQKAFTPDISTAEIKLAGMANADRCHLLVDHSKFSRNAFYAFAGFSQFENVICDASPDDAALPPNFLLA